MAQGRWMRKTQGTLAGGCVVLITACASAPEPTVEEMSAEGLARLDEGALSEARQILEPLAKQNPQSLEAVAAWIEVLLNEKRFTEALLAADESLVFHPDHSRLLDHKLNALRGAGQAQVALELLQTRLANDPDNAEWLYEIGELLHHVGKEKEALESFQKAQSLAPDWWQPAVAQAALLLSRGGEERAQQALERLTAVETKESPPTELLFHQALAHEQLSEDPDAEKAYLRLLEQSPEHLGGLTNYALLLERSGRTKEARLQLARALNVTQPRDKALREALQEKMQELAPRKRTQVLR